MQFTRALRATEGIWMFWVSLRGRETSPSFLRACIPRGRRFSNSSREPPHEGGYARVSLRASSQVLTCEERASLTSLDCGYSHFCCPGEASDHHMGDLDDEATSGNHPAIRHGLSSQSPSCRLSCAIQPRGLYLCLRGLPRRLTGRKAYTGTYLKTACL